MLGIPRRVLGTLPLRDGGSVARRLQLNAGLAVDVAEVGERERGAGCDAGVLRLERDAGHLDAVERAAVGLRARRDCPSPSSRPRRRTPGPGVESSVPTTIVARPAAGLATAFSHENLPSAGSSQLIPPSECANARPSAPTSSRSGRAAACNQCLTSCRVGGQRGEVRRAEPAEDDALRGCVVFGRRRVPRRARAISVTPRGDFDARSITQRATPNAAVHHDRGRCRRPVRAHGSASSVNVLGRLSYAPSRPGSPPADSRRESRPL